MCIFDFLKPNIEKMEKKGNVDGLIKALKNGDFVIRESAAFSLGKLKDQKAVEPLILALKDDKGRVKKYAASALGRIGDQRATSHY